MNKKYASTSFWKQWQPLSILNLIINKYLLLQFVFGVGKGTIDATRTGAAQAQIATQADLVLGAVSVRCRDRALAQRWLTCTVNTDELHQSRHHEPCRFHCLPYLDPAAQARLYTHNTTLKSDQPLPSQFMWYTTRVGTLRHWGEVYEKIFNLYHKIDLIEYKLTQKKKIFILGLSLLN